MSPSARLAVAAILLAFASCGCGAQVSGEALAGARTQADLDSAIARSSLPVAGVVDRAMRESGRQAGRAASLDSLQ